MRFRFFFSEALDSLTRNWVMSVAAIVTVLVSMFVLGIGAFVFFNLQNATSGVRNKLEIEVFIKNAASQDQINQLGDQIKSMPEVKDINFVSKDEALNRLRDSMKGHEDVLNALSGNPLPASYEIFLKDQNNIDSVARKFYTNPVVDNDISSHLNADLSPSATSMPVSAGDGTKFTAGMYFRIDNEVMRVSGDPNGDTVPMARAQVGTTAAAHGAHSEIVNTDGIKTGGETTDRVLKATNYILIGGAGFVALLAVASILLISNTIRLSIFARRREVEIMRLVGATNWFIRWPFVMEGVFTGLVGATGAVIMVLLVQNFFVNNIVEQMPFLGAETVPLFWLLLFIIGGGGVLGSVGSGLALRRFLKI